MKTKSILVVAAATFFHAASFAQTVHSGFSMDDHTKVRRFIGFPDRGSVVECPSGSVLSGNSCVPLPRQLEVDYSGATYQYVGDGGRCPDGSVAVGVGGFYATFTAGYLYCAPMR